MTAQRDCLNYAAELIKDIPGIVFEFGLGNGRSYDHLREKLPDHEIYVFDRRMAAFPSCTPPEDNIFIGEITLTLARAAKLFGKKVALLHNDFGTSDHAEYRKLIDVISPLLEPVMLPGALIVSNIRFHIDTWEKLPEPSGVKPDRYFIYRTGVDSHASLPEGQANFSTDVYLK